MKKLFEKLKHPNEKTKHRLQGVAIGSLLGVILTLTCVGVVGCSMTQGESKQPKMLRADYSGSLNGTSWQLNSTIAPYSSALYVEVNFTSNNTSFGVFNVTKGGNLIYYPVGNPNGSQVYHKDQSNKWYFGEEYRNVTFTSSPSSLETELRTWLNSNAVIVSSGASSSSSETTSSEATSSATSVTTSSEATTSEPETTSLDQSLGFVFNDNNPFSAWAVNPLSGDPAVNYDGGAPWLLYTGNPSGSGATTAQTALSTDYAVGSFYVNGNPSQTFDTIRVVTLNLTTDNAFILNGSTDAVQISADQYARGAFMVSEVQYRNSQTSASIKVYNFGLTSAKLNGQDINALTSGSWLNVGYRSILWTGGGDLTINGYTAPASWWLENNALSSASAVSTMILGNSSTGVFGLLASAFTCWGSIFGLALVPGLTIGTLLFVPLVVLVIFSIIKLLQK